jgi:sugar lactone lactonase YvrE
MSRAGDGKDTSYLYIADTAAVSAGGQRIDIFLRDDPSKGIVDTIRKRVSEPNGIFIDASGTLYVADDDESGHDKVTVYLKGSHTPSRVYRGIECAFDVVAGSDGAVYVADPCGTNGQGRVYEYAPGTTKKVRTLHPGGAPYAVTLDAKNNLYVAYDEWPSYAGQVKRYAPGATKGVALLPEKLVRCVGGVGLDDRGALLVSNECGGGVIDVFTDKGMPPSRIIKTGQEYPFRFAFDKRENRIYVSNLCQGDRVRRNTSSCGKKTNDVVALDYASGKRLWTLRERLWEPAGVATTPSAPF